MWITVLRSLILGGILYWTSYKARSITAPIATAT